jgi:predicted RNA-binding Zn-ribbon protein involved in translation (DUF1610 family)
MVLPIKGFRQHATQYDCPVCGKRTVWRLTPVGAERGIVPPDGDHYMCECGWQSDVPPARE